VIERGDAIKQRAEQVERYWTTGELDENSNVMFGEARAGTFSDGKLTSRSKDARGDLVLRTFVRFGAPEEITAVSKPHIGTDGCAASSPPCAVKSSDRAERFAFAPR
jgi:uncharacterized FAD-dependent dehydrogenase